MKIISMEGQLSASMQPGITPLSLDDVPAPRLVATVSTETSLSNVLGNLEDILLALNGRRVRIVVETLDDTPPSGPLPLETTP